MLKIYNTFTKQKEEFKPIEAGKVGIYTCGPTVYDYIHIGNLRSYTTPDILKRYLKYLGYEVKHVKNITDVGHLTQDDLAQGDSGEDKLVKKSLKEHKTPEEIAREYEDYFKKTELEMNILSADEFPRATEHVQDMIQIIEKLIEKGFAYEKNGNVFFEIAKFPEYGKLSGNTLENLNIGARLEEPHPDKKSQWDFALWLKAPKNHLMQWQSPWSIGYPGWHIECSAMSCKHLGERIDFHTGGEDNIFPHHEAEITQTESFTGHKWVNYWMHTRHLLVDNEKMSKSKGNFYILKDIIDKGFLPMDFRMLLLSSHYRSQMNFTWEGLEQARKNRLKINEFWGRIKLNSLKNNLNEIENKFDIESYKKKFEEAMNDDLNTPLALSVIFDFVKSVNSALDKNEISNLDEVKSFFEEIVTRVLGLKVSGVSIEQEDFKKALGGITDEKTKKAFELAEERKLCRLNGDYKRADELRYKIKDLGFGIKDDKNNEYRLVNINYLEIK